MSENIYPFQHSPYEDGTHAEPSIPSWDAIREAQEQYAKLVQEAKEYKLPHKHQIRIVNGMHYALRWCTVPGCMESWRMDVRVDGYKDEPIAAWERIEEPVDLNSPVLPDYED